MAAGQRGATVAHIIYRWWSVYCIILLLEVSSTNLKCEPFGQTEAIKYSWNPDVRCSIKWGGSNANQGYGFASRCWWITWSSKQYVQRLCSSAQMEPDKNLNVIFMKLSSSESPKIKHSAMEFWLWAMMESHPTHFLRYSSNQMWLC